MDAYITAVFKAFR